MDIRGIRGMDYRAYSVITDKDSNWDMMDFVKVI